MQAELSQDDDRQRVKGMGDIFLKFINMTLLPDVNMRFLCISCYYEKFPNGELFVMGVVAIRLICPFFH